MRTVIYATVMLGVAAAAYFGISSRPGWFNSWSRAAQSTPGSAPPQMLTGSADLPRNATPPEAALSSESTVNDREALFQTGDMLIRACRDNASQSVAMQIAPAAEFIDENGNVYRGRDKVVQAVAGVYSHDPDARLQTQIESIRFVSATVAIEDGTAALKSDTQAPVRSRYTAVHVKTDGKWVVASLREVGVTSDQ